MPNGSVKLVIPFDILADAVSELSLEDKQRLWELLYEQIEQDEEDRIEQDPAGRAEIEQALKDYEAGDYITFEEYLAQRQKNNQA
jgi:hypothetical protein